MKHICIFAVMSLGLLLSCADEPSVDASPKRSNYDVKVPVNIEKAKAGEDICTHLKWPLRTYVEDGKRVIIPSFDPENFSYAPKDSAAFFTTDDDCDVGGVCQYKFYGRMVLLDFRDKPYEVSDLCASTDYHTYGGKGYKGDDFEGEVLENEYNFYGLKGESLRLDGIYYEQDWVSYLTKVRTTKLNAKGKHLTMFMVQNKSFWAEGGEYVADHLNSDGEFDGSIPVENDVRSEFQAIYQ